VGSGGEKRRGTRDSVRGCADVILREAPSVPVLSNAVSFGFLANTAGARSVPWCPVIAP
jgi:hypothetical protein